MMSTVEVCLHSCFKTVCYFFLQQALFVHSIVSAVSIFPHTQKKKKKKKKKLVNSTQLSIDYYSLLLFLYTKATQAS